MKLSELGEAYDTDCEFVDYKGVSYGFRIKSLNYAQIQWFLKEDFGNQTKRRDDDNKEFDNREDFCEYVDQANVQDMSRVVHYIERWEFEDPPTEESFAVLYAKRGDIAVGIFMKIASIFRDVFYSTNAIMSQVKKK